MQRKYQRFMWLAAVALGALFIAACSSGTESPSNTVAATVNGKKIMLAEVERLIHQQSQGKESQLSPHDLAQARLQVLDNLIKREVLVQRAEQEKLQPSEDEITNVINKQKQDRGMTDEEYGRWLKDQSLTMEALREEAKKDIAIQKLQDKYASKIAINDREVEDYYNTNKSQFVNARGVGLAMIVVDPADNSGQGIAQGDAKNDAEAKAKIDAVYQQLKGGADFAEVARSKSEDRTGLLQGGDIGFANEDQLKQNGFPSETISQLMGPMQIGSFTAPVKFPSANNPGGRWYIFKLTDKRLQTENLTLESQFPNGDSVRHQITVTLTNERKDILSAAMIQVALSEAKIVNSLAANMLSNPANLGLRPAGTVSAKPESSTTPAPGSSVSPSENASASPPKAASPGK